MAGTPTGSTPLPGKGPSPPTHRRAVFGLQAKFTLLVVGLALAVGAIVGTVTIDFSSTLVRRLHRDHCRQMAALLASKAASDYAAGAAPLAELARQMVRTEPLLFVSFMDPAGQVLAAHWDKNLAHPPEQAEGFTPFTTIGSPRFVSGTQAIAAHLDVTYPVSRAFDESAAPPGERHPTLLGYVRIGFSLERTLTEITSTMNLLSGIAVLVFAMTVPLAFLMVQRLAGPLRNLSRTMARFADGDLEARTSVKRTDEIGELATAYNLMADKLAQKHREISELNAELEDRVQQRTAQLRELAVRDPLTGLYNRRRFNEDLRRRFAEAKRYGHELACMMIDLDDFKSVNDHFGHQVGDELLILAGITITTELRGADVAARFGGDEFIILLPQTDAPSAQILGERILAKLSAASLEQLSDCRATASVGVGCMVDVTTEDPDDLIRAADKALYEAKTCGKNTIVARMVTI